MDLDYYPSIPGAWPVSPTKKRRLSGSATQLVHVYNCFTTPGSGGCTRLSTTEPAHAAKRRCYEVPGAWYEDDTHVSYPTGATAPVVRRLDDQGDVEMLDAPEATPVKKTSPQASDRASYEARMAPTAGKSYRQLVGSQPLSKPEHPFESDRERHERLRRLARAAREGKRRQAIDARNEMEDRRLIEELHQSQSASTSQSDPSEAATFTSENKGLLFTLSIGGGVHAVGKDAAASQESNPVTLASQLNDWHPFETNQTKSDLTQDPKLVPESHILPQEDATIFPPTPTTPPNVAHEPATPSAGSGNGQGQTISNATTSARKGAAAFALSLGERSKIDLSHDRKALRKKGIIGQSNLQNGVRKKSKTKLVLSPAATKKLEKDHLAAATQSPGSAKSTKDPVTAQSQEDSMFVQEESPEESSKEKQGTKEEKQPQENPQPQMQEQSHLHTNTPLSARMSIFGRLLGFKTPEVRTLATPTETAFAQRQASPVLYSPGTPDTVEASRKLPIASPNTPFDPLREKENAKTRAQRRQNEDLRLEKAQKEKDLGITDLNEQFKHNLHPHKLRTQTRPSQVEIVKGQDDMDMLSERMRSNAHVSSDAFQTAAQHMTPHQKIQQQQKSLNSIRKIFQHVADHKTQARAEIEKAVALAKEQARKAKQQQEEDERRERLAVEAAELKKRLAEKRARGVIHSIDEKLAQQVQEAANPYRETAAYAMNLTGRDFGKLVPDEAWLNDEVVNTYLSAMVASRLAETGYNKADKAQIPKFHAFNSALWTTYNKSGWSGVSRWFTRARIGGERMLECDKVLIPVNTGVHWTLVAIMGRRRRVEYYDSLGGSATRMNAFAMDLVAKNLGSAFKKEEWTTAATRSARQINGSDCGVFVCLNALALILDRSPADTVDPQRIYPDARNMVAATLLNGGFSGAFALEELKVVAP